jgi:hypothetical protein
MRSIVLSFLLLSTRGAVAAAAELGVWMVNVHASGGARMMTAAREALLPFGKDAPLLIAVTVLTSMESSDLQDLGITLSPADYAAKLAALTQRCVSRWEGDSHSHVHMTLREFVKRKIITGVTIADAAKSKLQGGDPIAEFLGDCIDDDGITLDDITRVIAWFDN